MKRLSKVLSVVLLLLFFSFSFDYSFFALTRDFERKINKDLKAVMNSADDDTVFPVVIWLNGVSDISRQKQLERKISIAKEEGVLRCDTVNGINLSNNCEDNEQIDSYIRIKRDNEKVLHCNYNTTIKNKLNRKYGINTDSMKYNTHAPMLVDMLSKHDIYQLIQCSDVDSVYLYDDSIYEEEMNAEIEGESVRNQTSGNYPYGVWQDITNVKMLRDYYGYTGAGIKIGLIENHVPDFDYWEFSIDDRMRLSQLFGYMTNNNQLHIIEQGAVDRKSDISHAHYVLSILTGRVDEDYCGVAPDAEFFCTEYNPSHASSPGSFFDGFDELIDRGVNIINASIAWGDIQSNYNYISKYLDYLSSNYDVTICMSTGNTSNGNHNVHNGAMAYNIISVGNIDDHNTISLDDDNIYHTSRYSSGTDAVYKPDICAPGNRCATYLSPDTNINGGGGTSAAAPIATGICALLMEAKPYLKTEPILLKSILMSSAINLQNMTNIYSDTTSVNPALLRNYGAGMIDAYQAFTTINEHRVKYNLGNWHMEITKTINISQDEISQSKDMYICAAWSQWVTYFSDDYRVENNYHVLYGFDHQLKLYDPNNQLVAQSIYTLDRKQFIRYKPLQSGTYTIKVNRINDGIQTPAYYPKLAISCSVK